MEIHLAHVRLEMAINKTDDQIKDFSAVFATKIRLIGCF